MKVKMKICIKCNTLLSNSSKVCTRCGSKEIEKGFYTDELNKTLEFNKQLYKPNSDITNIDCPTCSAPVTIENRYGECCFCGDEIFLFNRYS